MSASVLPDNKLLLSIKCSHLKKVAWNNLENPKARKQVVRCTSESLAWKTNKEKAPFQAISEQSVRLQSPTGTEAHGSICLPVQRAISFWSDERGTKIFTPVVLSVLQNEILNSFQNQMTVMPHIGEIMHQSPSRCPNCHRENPID